MSLSARGAQGVKKVFCYLQSQLPYIYDETNAELLRNSGIPLNTCSPWTRAAYSEMCPIKWPTQLKQPHYRRAGRRRLLQVNCL
jgi:hypothetical protein